MVPLLTDHWGVTMRSAPTHPRHQHHGGTTCKPCQRPPGSHAWFGSWHAVQRPLRLSQVSAVPFVRWIGAGGHRLSKDRPCPGGGLLSTRCCGGDMGLVSAGIRHGRANMYVLPVCSLPSCCCCMSELVTSVWVPGRAFAGPPAWSFSLLTGLTMPSAATRRRGGTAMSRAHHINSGDGTC